MVVLRGEVVRGFLGGGFGARVMLVATATVSMGGALEIVEVVRGFLACGFGAGVMFVGGFCARGLRLETGLFCIFFMS